MTESHASLVAEIAQARRHGRRLDGALRAKIVAYCEKQNDAGISWATLAKRLSVPLSNLHNWRPRGEGASRLAPVRVVAAPQISSPTTRFVVRSASGYFVADLTFEEATSMLRVLHAGDTVPSLGSATA
jgi:hypothetical protein